MTFVDKISSTKSLNSLKSLLSARSISSTMQDMLLQLSTYLKMGGRKVSRTGKRLLHLSDKAPSKHEVGPQPIM